LTFCVEIKLTRRIFLNVILYILDSMKFHTPEATSPLKPLSVDVLGHRAGAGSRNGVDSGYNSTPGNQAVEARLQPHTSVQGLALGAPCHKTAHSFRNPNRKNDHEL
jgi:hypothetical protein